MHYLQKKILDSLRVNTQMHYSDLQPEGIESSHFKYHLNQLITDGVVAKKERGIYQLTESGQSYVDKLSVNTIKPKNMPKVITYTVIKVNDKYVLYKKDKEPYMGLLNIVGGKVHTGESIIDASRREVYEKLNLNIKPKVVGAMSIRINKSRRLFTHAIALICAAEIQEVPKSENIVTLNMQSILTSKSIAPDLLDALRFVESRSRELVELNLEM